MPPREDVILFLDLETTGTDVPKDEIIEVGLSLISTDAGAGYPELAAEKFVVEPSYEALERLRNKKVVREMHEANGLLYAITHGYAFNNIAWVDNQVVNWLNIASGATDDTHIPLGGSGVTHFDRRFIKHFMPKLDARLTHWAYDMGVMRRMFVKAGVPPYSQEGKDHRALTDARVHADEFRYYQKFITLNG